MSNASLTDYKGLNVLAATPTGAGGQAINDNFRKLADRLAYLSDRDPQVSDVSDPSPNGFAFTVGSRWFNTTSGTEWICTGSTPVDQQPVGLVWQQTGADTNGLQDEVADRISADANLQTQITAISNGLTTKVPTDSPTITGLFTHTSTSGVSVTMDGNTGNVGIGEAPTTGGNRLTVAGVMRVNSNGQTYFTGNGFNCYPVGDCVFANSIANSNIIFSYANASTKFTAAHGETSGSVSHLQLLPAYNQTSGTASNTDLLISRNETAIGSGSQFLICALTNGVTKFSVSRTGTVYTPSSVYCASVFGGNGGDFLLATNTGAATVQINGYGGRTYTSADNGVEMSGQIWANTSGSSAAVAILPTYSQTSGTASNTDLLINRTQTAVGSGFQSFIDCQVAGVSKFRISNSGWFYGEGLTFTSNPALGLREAYGLKFMGGDAGHPVQVSDSALLVGMTGNGNSFPVGSVVQASGAYHYFGDPNTDGCIRIGAGTGANVGKLVKQVRGSGTWGAETVIA